MWFAMAALQKKGRPLDYVKGFVVSWIGNFIGALFVAYVFSYWTQTLSEEPYRSGVIQMVKEDIVEHEWHVIFLKAIACGYLVRTRTIPECQLPTSHVLISWVSDR